VPGGRRVNPAAFKVPPPETQGNLRRGAVRGWTARQIDAALRREFRWGETGFRLQFRLEMYNVLNTPLFLDPLVVLEEAGFGVASRSLSSTAGTNAVYQYGGSRSAQVVIKVLF
jgi:hypothetical protein